ncbi:hypothetical protein EMIHUDRAFT_235363 [Emiliania huxleyi CCMP1516]|uniref:Uncharacterized protein n=2 Tax=Emiliania huxleyi TaxID=2903 RepID=A0A0D3JWN1_EMIH1|nr:hypothetical protein EMIHUDRAFT_235363 [Emiliania huxleyi CCMP1516]EOD27916.1 hypothetical protein EMIHUDRAFT_235363 [Emiliania huxleyi CCMP1516]|eukprot:XP_005780345.1 hypothetical protein EMIHUDRAFT_235363 [Emiliania huxleyi CCMP1516]
MTQTSAGCQAASYFDEDAFAALTDALTAFGQHELGCRAISPPWLSFYVDGCEQRLHADVPQATARTTLPNTLPGSFQLPQPRGPQPKRS